MNKYKIEFFFPFILCIILEFYTIFFLFNLTLN